MKKVLLTQILYLAFLISLYSQTFVNEVWNSSFGEPDQVTTPSTVWDEINWTASTINDQDELIIVGNTKQANGTTDIITTKYNNDGQTIWEKTFTGNNNSSGYGIATILDNNGNIITAGVTTNDNLTTDIIILKYSPTGILIWSSIIGANNNQFDVPTTLISDLGGNIFIAGGSLNPSTETDWIVAKLNNNGILQWNVSYNFANQHEVPVAIQIENSGNLLIQGVSGSTPTSYDLVELKFAESSGAILFEERTEIPNLSVDDAFDISKDNEGNFYLVGSTKNNGNGDQVIQLVKINTDFEIEWIRKVDIEGFNDVAKSVVIDNSGDIIIAGNSKKADKESRITFAKYDTDGNEIFIRNYFTWKSSEIVELEKLKITSDNKILMTGSIERSENIDFLTLLYDEEGLPIFEKFYNSENDSKDIATNIELPSTGEIMIIGKSVSDDSKYTAIKYQTLERTNQAVYVNGIPSHKENELIIKFPPQYVDTNFVNNPRKRYGTLDDILVTAATNKINESIELRGITFVKMYPRFRTLHTYSISRLGDTIPIPEFWSTFLLITPSGYDIQGLITQFELMPEYIKYSHPNYIYELTNIPNDEFFGTDNQQSLFAQGSSEYPNANINIDGAWDIETGKGYTRVGVYDAPIIWEHEDFGDGTVEGSQIKGGFNYVSGFSSPPFNFNINQSHGTAVGGIIGALRNNDKGIAGIAGGGFDAQGNNNPGVQLFTQIIAYESSIFPDFFADDVIVGQAIGEGATDLGSNFIGTDMPGLGLHIMNHSWGRIDHPLTPVSESLYDALEYAFRNNVLTVAAKGNDGIDESELLSYPADYRDEAVLCVGASGYDGKYFNGTNGDDFLNATLDCQWSSNYGDNMDVIAPGVTEVVSSLNGDQIWGSNDCPGHPAPIGTGTLANYQAFNGTSASAPHVSGVAALMHSLHNTQNIQKPQYNNLAPEDYEYMLQEYAIDIADIDYPVGPDKYNGYGRIDASAVLQKLEAPNWRIWHSSHFTPEKVTENLGTTTIQGLDVTTFKVTHTYGITFAPTTQIKAAWKRNSAVIGQEEFPFYASMGNRHNANFEFNYTVDENVANVIVTMYFYKKEFPNGTTSWQTTGSSAAKSAFSLHLFDPNGITNVEEIQLGEVKVIPNPTHDKIQLNFDLDNVVPHSIHIFDVMGKMIYHQNISSSEKQILEIDLSKFSSGIYFLHLLTNKGAYTSKVIKQ